MNRNTPTSEENAKPSVSVLLVDDSPLIRMSLRVALPLESDGRLQIVGEAENGLEALALGAELAPRVVLMDVGMPQMDGIKATQQWRERGLSGAVIMLTSHEQEREVVDAFRAGATSYCLKETEPKELANIVLQTAEGHSWIDPKIARFVLSHLMQQSQQLSIGNRAANGLLTGKELSKEVQQGKVSTHANPENEAFGWINLSQRELEVLALMCEGESNAGISSGLHISANTVKTHVKNIYQKLGVDDRTSAVLLALKEGLLPQV
jgi:two-component system, NarL family, response regulator LiaR